MIAKYSHSEECTLCQQPYGLNSKYWIHTNLKSHMACIGCVRSVSAFLEDAIDFCVRPVDGVNADLNPFEKPDGELAA